MPFDPRTALTIAQAAGKMRGRAGRPHVETVARWIKKGCRLPSGETVKLRAVKWGGSWLLMPEWIEDFERARLLGGLVA